ncbi:MAG: hypothetical protein ACYCXG_10575 [Acidiferrobacter sp.]
MTAQRAVYLTAALMILLGIALTGFTRVNGLLYVPAALLGFAGITGVCPGLRFWQRLGLP